MRVHARQVFFGISQIGVEIADGFFFFAHKIIHCRLRGKFGQTQLDVARLHELVVILINFVIPRLHFDSNGFVQALFARIFINKAHNIQALAHGRAIGLD